MSNWFSNILPAIEALPQDIGNAVSGRFSQALPPIGNTPQQDPNTTAAVAEASAAAAKDPAAKAAFHQIASQAYNQIANQNSSAPTAPVQPKSFTPTMQLPAITAPQLKSLSPDQTSDQSATVTPNTAIPMEQRSANAAAPLINSQGGHAIQTAVNAGNNIANAAGGVIIAGGNAIAAPIQQTAAYTRLQMNPQAKSQLAAINSNPNLSQEQKIAQGNILLQQFGGQNAAQSQGATNFAVGAMAPGSLADPMNGAYGSALETGLDTGTTAAKAAIQTGREQPGGLEAGFVKNPFNKDQGPPTAEGLNGKPGAVKVYLKADDNTNAAQRENNAQNAVDNIPGVTANQKYQNIGTRYDANGNAIPGRISAIQDLINAKTAANPTSITSATLRSNYMDSIKHLVAPEGTTAPEAAQLGLVTQDQANLYADNYIRQVELKAGVRPEIDPSTSTKIYTLSDIAKMKQAENELNAPLLAKRYNGGNLSAPEQFRLAGRDAYDKTITDADGDLKNLTMEQSGLHDAMPSLDAARRQEDNEAAQALKTKQGGMSKAKGALGKIAAIGIPVAGVATAALAAGLSNSGQGYSPAENASQNPIGQEPNGNDSNNTQGVLPGSGQNSVNHGSNISNPTMNVNNLPTDPGKVQPMNGKWNASYLQNTTDSGGNPILITDDEYRQQNAAIKNYLKQHPNDVNAKNNADTAQSVLDTAYSGTAETRKQYNATQQALIQINSTLSSLGKSNSPDFFDAAEANLPVIGDVGMQEVHSMFNQGYGTLLSQAKSVDATAASMGIKSDVSGQIVQHQCVRG